MILIVAGSRDFHDYALAEDEICNLIFDSANDDAVIIESIMSGTARGADRLGERFAKEYGMELIKRPADWDAYGRSAGYKRNARMASEADALIAFWDGKSRGTKNMIDLARKQGIPCKVVIVTLPKPKPKVTPKGL